MERIDWNAITITDPYMFGTVFRVPELCKELLEKILGISIEHIVFTDEEQSKVPELGAKGIRMDVYVADEDGTVYDIEMQNANEGNLEKRSRYYLSANDMDCISRGVLYEDMNDSFVVFICTFDPFKRGSVRYTVTPHCKEDGVEMADGATRVFINAKAWDTCADKSFGSFLGYLAGDTIAKDDFSKKVDEAVRSVRQRPEWRRNRMRLETYLEEQRLRAIKEGLEEGRKEGRKDEQRINALLAEALVREGRTEELPRALTDLSVRQSLLTELGIV